MVQRHHMPERQRGRDPNKGQKHKHKQEREEEESFFIQAARYPHEEASKPPYDAAQQAIYETPCDLSAYRFQMAPEYNWHIAVLGSPPPEELQRRITVILATGRPTTLPEVIVNQLRARRTTQEQHGEWVEGHYPHRRRTQRSN